MSPKEGDSDVNNSPCGSTLTKMPENIISSQENVTVETSKNNSKEKGLEEVENLHINIDRLKVKTVRVPISVNGVSCFAVVDTGAELSVLKNSTYEQIPEEVRPPLSQAKRKLVVAEAGKEMSVCGMNELDIEVGGFKFIWPVYVAPIRDDLLLGWDIIYHHKFAIDPEKGFRVKDKWLSLEVTQQKRNVAGIEIRRSITVPANSEFVVSCQCEDTLEGDYLFEPVVLSRVIAAKAMVRPHKNSET